MLRDCFDLCLAVCICKYVYVSGLCPTKAGGSNDVRLLPSSAHTHTHKLTHFLSAALCSPVSVPLDSIVLEIHSSYRVASLCRLLTQVRACMQRHPHTHTCKSTARWTDLIIQAEQLNLTEEQAPKRKHEGNIKGLFPRVV